MQQLLKLTTAIIGISTLSFFAACNNSGSETKTDTKDSTHTEATHEGDHVFACPMHPEVTGKEGDNCPKCGMKLEHNDNAGASGNVTMQFSTNPVIINPGEEVTLLLTPKMNDKPNEQVALEVEHEKKIHLIVVNDDLSWFNHIHPEYYPDGSYTVKEIFPAAGKYTLFADYKPSAGNHTVDILNVNVTGKAPDAKTFGADKLSGISGNYSFTLEPAGGILVTDVLMHIKGIVKLNGKEIDANSLENYLGAKAHMVIVSLADKKYLHVHPDISKGAFDLHTTFDKPGLYRGWVQFNAAGKLHTIDFTMNVKKSTEEDIKKVNAAHTKSHTSTANEHDEHDSH
ncbi:MAG: heavy metal-binding domain-containing protein [Chitinophagaceae bacterium]